MKKLTNNKTKLIATIALVLLMTTILLMIPNLPAVFAQTTLPGYTPMPDRNTATTVGVTPTLVGLGQSVLINVITFPGPSGPTYYAQDLAGAITAGWSNITCTITHPDGHQETFMPVDITLKQIGIEIPGQAQIVGTLMFRWTPPSVGDYSITASFPGKFYTTDEQYEPLKLSVWYKPSDSNANPITFTVQEDEVLAGQLNGWPWSPLPENYWEDPVQTNNREWYAISGDWVQPAYDMLGVNYNSYTTAPRAPHIVWKQPIGQAGLLGGVWGSYNYASFFGLMGAGAGAIILDGKMYQNLVAGGFECVDIRTGEQLWTADGSVSGAFRLQEPFQTASQANEGGASSYLWGGISPGPWNPPGATSSSTWVQYSPFDGHVIRTIENVPTDLTAIRYDDGNPEFWCVQEAGLWNSTGYPLAQPGQFLIKWDYVKFYNSWSSDWSQGIVWNVSMNLPTNVVNMADSNFGGCIPYPFYGAGVVLVKPHNDMAIMQGYDINTGALLWVNNATVLDIDVVDTGMGLDTYGPYLKRDGGSDQFVAYDVTTGQEEWRASTGELPWSMLPSYTFVYHDGVHFMGSFDGHVYAYNNNDGSLVWQSDWTGADDAFREESIYGNQPFVGSMAMGCLGADGVLYYSSQTVYGLVPATRFHAMWAIDEATGHFLWKLPIGISPTSIASGYIIGKDIDNGIQYCIGKGETATTVTAPLTTVPLGTDALIQGSVMDLSPGQPNTPAVSDEDMSEWMDYLHGQNATLINTPPAPNGVPVQLIAFGSDGSIYDLGTVTSDVSGNFKKAWAPPKEDVYTISATFAGSDSYWSSWASTGLSVGPAPASDVTPEPTTPEPAQPLISTEAIIIAAVAVVAVVAIVAYWALRRRK